MYQSSRMFLDGAVPNERRAFTLYRSITLGDQWLRTGFAVPRAEIARQAALQVRGKIERIATCRLFRLARFRPRVCKGQPDGSESVAQLDQT